MKNMNEVPINDIKITGGNKLHGEITTNSSKNGATHLLCASLLNKGTTTLRGVPRIEEVNRIIEIFESIGVKLEWIGDRDLKIKTPEKFDFENINRESAGQVRSFLMAMGSLPHRMKEFKIPNAGGCKMGNRSITAFRHSLSALGLSITTNETDYILDANKLHSADITMYEASDTATTATLLLASCIKGETTIRFAPPNYQVQDVCFFLERCGVKIDGIGNTTMTVHGIDGINLDIEHWVSEDPIESMMFISAGAVTKSELLVKRCPIDFLRLELLKLTLMGLKTEISKEYKSYNERTTLVDIKVFPSDLVAPNDKIHSLPYPGINTDNLPFFVPVATQAEGTTMIHDWMWENRAIYFTELNRLGANITLMDPHRVLIQGPTALRGARIVCPPALRPSMIILVSMLAAKGESVLHSVYSINRGYENIFERLNSIGAEISILN